MPHTKDIKASAEHAFFEQGVDSSDVFGQLAIAKSENYKEYLNQSHVIYIDFSRVSENCETYKDYIMRISETMKEDLAEAYPDLKIDKKQAVWDLLLQVFQKKKDKFIFVMDEWDAIFHMPFISGKEQKEYLLFLKNLLKDQVYVEFAYMTGVLPVAKYSSGSELNMFLEYNMVTRKKYGEYFGFSDKEVDRLFAIYQKETIDPGISREDLRVWYDGYFTASGEKMYNPRSIIRTMMRRGKFSFQIEN